MGTASAGDPAPAKRSEASLVFPVVGPVTYTDDFGDPRSGWRHEGNDLMAAKRSLAVAAEAGTVKFWTTSRNAGCMLYLYGESGTTYLYIHLNNDLTKDNDNRGSCVAGVAYAPQLKSGDHVEAGEPVGFVGDSGDANGIASHLHFEVHPKDGAAVSPFPYLQRATRLLFAAEPGSTFTLAVTGTVVSLAGGRIVVKTSLVRSWPGGRKAASEGPLVAIAIPETADVDPGLSTADTGPIAKGAPSPARVTVFTEPATVTLAAQAGAAGTLTAARIVRR